MGSNSSQVASKIELPEWVNKQAEENMGLAKDIASKPYQTYSGQRLAGFNDDQNAAFGATRATQGAQQPALNSALAALGGVSSRGAPMIGATPSGLDGLMRARGGDIGAAHTPGRMAINGLAANDTSLARLPQMSGMPQMPRTGGGDPYLPVHPVNQNFGQVPQVDAAKVDPSGLERVDAERIASERFTDADINAYLNPYKQAALDPAIAEIQRQGQILQNNNMARAQGAGAFGGSRHGLVEAETNRAILDQIARTQAEGLSRGFDTAAGLVSNDQGRALQAAQANQSTGLQGDLANQNVTTQAQFRNQDAQNQMRALQAQLQQQTNLANQSAALQKMGIDINAANSQGALAKLGQDMAYTDIAKLMGMGDTQQKMDQSNLDLGYNDFLKEQNYPQEQLNMLISALNQTPYGRTTYQPGPNTAAQVGGGLASLLGLFMGR